MSPFPSTIMRRFSRSSSVRKNQQQTAAGGAAPQSPTSYTHPPNLAGPGGAGGGSVREQALGGGYTVVPNDGRPISSATDGSFDFASRPVTGTTAATNPGGVGSRSGVGPGTGSMRASQRYSQPVPAGVLSRTDQIVLQHFWESKYHEDTKKDLHYLKFPYFPQYPAHKDLLPYCEIYHLVKTSPGATIISLGSANGVYIGFELATGSQLHIDLDDDWFTNASSTSITHHRVTFRPYGSMLADPDAPAVFKTWPKPLTIEFLEAQYQAWCRDLMSICWESSEVRELGSGNGSAGDHVGGSIGSAGSGIGRGGAAPTSGSVRNSGTSGMVGTANGTSALRNSGSGNMGGPVQQPVVSSQGNATSRNAPDVVDDGYASERSNDPGV